MDIWRADHRPFKTLFAARISSTILLASAEGSRSVKQLEATCQNGISYVRDIAQPCRFARSAFSRDLGLSLDEKLRFTGSCICKLNYAD